jgi:hypothetical protein
MNVLVVNRLNNMGDVMCQLRGLKEWKDKQPEITTLNFTSSEYLHILAATHADIFDQIMPDTFSHIAQKLPEYKKEYDKVIEFEIDWRIAVTSGILRAWTEKTLGFVPSTDKPLWNVQPEEILIAQAHERQMRQRFKKLMFVQLEAPSGYVRSFRYEDWEKILDMVPTDIGIVYPGPIDLAVNGRLRHRPNLFLLAGYDMGVTAALIKHCIDFFFVTHGGMAMMAHAQDRKEVIHTIFQEGGSDKLLSVPEWTNFLFPSHNDVDFAKIEKAIQSYL